MIDTIELPTPEQARAAAFLELPNTAPIERWSEALDASYEAWRRGESIEMFRAKFRRAMMSGQPFMTPARANRQ